MRVFWEALDYLNSPCKTPCRIKATEMDQALQEILEIPGRGRAFVESTSSFELPRMVPYLGMGSSYFAALAFRYMGIGIFPSLASEYFNYLRTGAKEKDAVILSQSGRSTEVLWCCDLFETFTAITNTAGSPLARRASVVIDIMAGEELNSSSKTYTNTLLALFRGFGIHTADALQHLSDNMERYQQRGEQLARDVFDLLRSRPVHGIYITGSGPNISTAMEAALILSESTKRSFCGLPMAQYDHGPKETAENSIVIQIVARGASYDRTLKLSESITRAGAHVFQVEDTGLPENLSVLTNVVPFNFMAYYLAKMLGAGDTFKVGGKVTEVE